MFPVKSHLNRLRRNIETKRHVLGAISHMIYAVEICMPNSSHMNKETWQSLSRLFSSSSSPQTLEELEESSNTSVTDKETQRLASVSLEELE